MNSEIIIHEFWVLHSHHQSYYFEKWRKNLVFSWSDHNTGSESVSFPLDYRFLSLTSVVIPMWRETDRSTSLRLPWIDDEMWGQSRAWYFASQDQRIPWGHFHGLFGPCKGCCRWAYTYRIVFSENWNKEKSMLINIIQKYRFLSTRSRVFEMFFDLLFTVHYFTSPYSFA